MKRFIVAVAAVAAISGLVGYQVGGWLAQPRERVIYMTQEGPKDDLPEDEGIAIAEYDETTYTTTFTTARLPKEIRQDNFGQGHRGQVKVQFHPGGERCEEGALKDTILAVVQHQPNLRSHPDFLSLLFETLAVETGLGREKVSTGAQRWGNYGIAQFRVDTARETLKWLKAIRPDVHAAVMDFYDGQKGLKDNLSYNVPFSIALMAQYYWRRVPDIYSNIGDREARAKVWKVAYNSPLGLGTVNAYLERTGEGR